MMAQRSPGPPIPQSSPMAFTTPRSRRRLTANPALGTPSRFELADLAPLPSFIPPPLPPLAAALKPFPATPYALDADFAEMRRADRQAIDETLQHLTICAAERLTEVQSTLTEIEEEKRRINDALRQVGDMAKELSETLKHERDEVDETRRKEEEVARRERALRVEIDTLRSDVEELQTKLAARRALKLRQRESFQKQTLKNAPEVAFFEEKLGLKIRGRARDVVQFKFQNIDQGSYNRTFSFELDASQPSYTLSSISPPTFLPPSVTAPLLATLNSGRDLYAFVREMRYAFRDEVRVEKMGLVGPKSSRFRIKNGHLFAIFLGIGVGATSWGLYDYYKAFTTYPSPIRTHLRAALRLSNTKDYVKASQAFEKAYALANELGERGEFGPKGSEESVLKISGIAVRWGAMWEEAGERGEARKVYEEVLKALKERSKAGEKVRERAAGVSLKIGDLWVDQGKDDRAEEYFVWGLEELMRIRMSDAQREKVGKVLEAQEKGGEFKAEKKGEEEEAVPKWLEGVAVVGAMERLGDLYARAGKVEYAQPLLQQAVASLFPPPPTSGPKPPLPPVPTQCHAATIMNNLSSTYIPASGKASPKDIDAASRWARQALSVAYGCRKEVDKLKQVPAEREDGECDRVAVVGAYNLGKLSEMAGDKESAKAWFEKSRKQAMRTGFVEGAREIMAPSSIHSDPSTTASTGSSSYGFHGRSRFAPKESPSSETSSILSSGSERFVAVTETSVTNQVSGPVLHSGRGRAMKVSDENPGAAPTTGMLSKLTAHAPTSALFAAVDASRAEQHQCHGSRIVMGHVLHGQDDSSDSIVEGELLHGRVVAPSAPTSSAVRASAHAPPPPPAASRSVYGGIAPSSIEYISNDTHEFHEYHDHDDARSIDIPASVSPYDRAPSFHHQQYGNYPPSPHSRSSLPLPPPPSRQYDRPHSGYSSTSSGRNFDRGERRTSGAGLPEFSRWSPTWISGGYSGDGRAYTTHPPPHGRAMTEEQWRAGPYPNEVDDGDETAGWVPEPLSLGEPEWREKHGGIYQHGVGFEDSSATLGKSSKKVEDRLRRLEKEFGEGGKGKGARDETPLSLKEQMKKSSEERKREKQELMEKSGVDSKGRLVVLGPGKRSTMRWLQGICALMVGVGSVGGALLTKPEGTPPPASKTPLFILYVAPFVSLILTMYLFVIRPCCMKPRHATSNGNHLVIPLLQNGNGESPGGGGCCCFGNRNKKKDLQGGGHTVNLLEEGTSEKEKEKT
ncbi:hypothetical protein MNV49_006725 [Pseudohyphozyma bogoriensis]|nr:hypothetical protein MNV49_006725 [Pseudohyphozyma bogoriensis]